MSRVGPVSLLLAAAACSASPAAPRAATSPGAASLSSPGAVAATSRTTEWVFGYSVRGRPLRVWQLGDPAAARRLLVVGVIHGDEPAGQAIALNLLRQGVPN